MHFRREFLSRLAKLPMVAAFSHEPQAQRVAKLKVLEKSAWGTDDPTRACFPFLHALAFADSGHEVRIFLLGEAVTLMRRSVVSVVVPVGWPPLSETMDKIMARKIQVFA
jgi:predicted peroxiredoxin